jgi:hypothetical protein
MKSECRVASAGWVAALLMVGVGCDALKTASPKAQFEAFAPKAVSQLKEKIGFDKASKPAIKLKKTDSLTHPYEGEIIFEATSLFSSEEVDLKHRSKMNVKAVYEGDGKEWDFKNGEYVTTEMEILEDKVGIGRDVKKATIGKRFNF